MKRKIPKDDWGRKGWVNQLWTGFAIFCIWAIGLFGLMVFFFFMWSFDIHQHTEFKRELQEFKEREGNYKLVVECTKYDNKGWINTTTITTHIHYIKYYQTYLDLKDMVNKYEECEVQE